MTPSTQLGVLLAARAAPLPDLTAPKLNVLLHIVLLHNRTVSPMYCNHQEYIAAGQQEAEALRALTSQVATGLAALQGSMLGLGEDAPRGPQEPSPLAAQDAAAARDVRSCIPVAHCSLASPVLGPALLPVAACCGRAFACVDYKSWVGPTHSWAVV